MAEHAARVPAEGPLRRLPADLAEQILAGSQPRRLAASEILSPPPPALIVEGVVEVFMVGPDGRRLAVCELRTGNMIGVAGAVGGRHRLGVQAVADCSLLQLDPTRLEGLLAIEPLVTQAVTEELAYQLDSIVTGVARYFLEEPSS